MKTIQIPLTQHEFDTLMILSEERGVTLEEFMCSLASSFFYDKSKSLDVFCKAYFLLNEMYPERA